MLGTEWGFTDGENFQITIRDGVQWSDGTPFTTGDVLTTFSLLRLMSNTVWGYIDEVTAVDESIVNFHMSKPSTRRRALCRPHVHATDLCLRRMGNPGR